MVVNGCLEAQGIDHPTLPACPVRMQRRRSNSRALVLVFVRIENRIEELHNKLLVQGFAQRIQLCISIDPKERVARISVSFGVSQSV